MTFAPMTEIVLTSSVLILAVLAIRFFFRNSLSRRVQYALWALVLVRLLVPFSVGSGSWSVATAAQPVQQTVSKAAEKPIFLRPYTSFSAEEYRQTLPDDDLETILSEEVHPYQDPDVEGPVYAVVGSDGDTVTVYRQRVTPAQMLTCVWYIGMALTGAWFLLANLLFYFKLRGTRRTLDGEDCKQKVFVSDAIPSPCLFGFPLPSIYLTSRAAEAPAARRYSILHEETHARHWDPLWSLLRGVCLTLYWFHPLVWVAAYVSRIDCELACDEGVLSRLPDGERIPYGQTLVDLIPVKKLGTSPLLSATTMTTGKKQMKDRITRIAQNRKPLLWALAVVAVLAVIVCAVTFTGAGEQETESPKGMAAEQQLEVLVEHRNEWTVASSAESGWQAYAVTDLDQDGQLELIAAWFDENGAHNRFYEVDTEGSTLKPPYELEGNSTVFNIIPRWRTERVPVATGGTARVAKETCPVYIEWSDTADATRYWYIFETNIPGRTDEDTSLSSVKQAFSMGEHGLEVRLLGFTRILPAGSSYYDAESKEITQDEYLALADQAFSGQAVSSVLFYWLEDFLPGEYDRERLTAHLRCSYEGFDLGNSKAAPLDGVSSDPSRMVAPKSEEEAARVAFRRALNDLIFTGYYRNADNDLFLNLSHLLWDSEERKYTYGWDNYADNRFAVRDVDGDGKEELLLWLKANASGLKSDCVYVLRYDPAKRSLLSEGQFGPGVTFYDNGYATDPLSGGHSGDYMLYRYDPRRDYYIPLEANQEFEPGETMPFAWHNLTLENLETVLGLSATSPIGAVPFADILGLSGYYVNTESSSGKARIFYGYLPDGSAVPFAVHNGDAPEEAWVRDLDGDGLTELVCNNQAAPGSRKEVTVYLRAGNGILYGGLFAGGAAPTDWDVAETNSWWSEYDPDREVFVLHYAPGGSGEITKEWTTADLNDFWFYEYGDLWTKAALQTAQGPEVAAYQELLKGFMADLNQGRFARLPGVEWEAEGGYSGDRFAICDIDGDGSQELLLQHNTTAVAGMREYIFRYNTVTEEAELQGSFFPGVTYLENGYLMEPRSHNQQASPIWPYDLWRYLPRSDSYQTEAFVTGYNAAGGNVYAPSGIVNAPEQGGVWYAVSTPVGPVEPGLYPGQWDSRTMNGAEYLRWAKDVFGTARELRPDWHNLTSENVDAYVAPGSVLPTESTAPVSEPPAIFKTYWYPDPTADSSMFDFSITLYEDGTFQYYETPISSYLGRGNWLREGDLITISDTRTVLNDDGATLRACVNRFQIVGDELHYLAQGSDNFTYVKLEDGAVFTSTPRPSEPTPAPEPEPGADAQPQEPLAEALRLLADPAVPVRISQNGGETRNGRLAASQQFNSIRDEFTYTLVLQNQDPMDPGPTLNIQPEVDTGAKPVTISFPGYDLTMTAFPGVEVINVQQGGVVYWFQSEYNGSYSISPYAPFLQWYKDSPAVEN